MFKPIKSQNINIDIKMNILKGCFEMDEIYSQGGTLKGFIVHNLYFK